MLAARTTGLALLAISVVLTSSQIIRGQKPSPAISKARAISEVHVRTLPGWREVISNDGRFRILFPGEARIENEVISMIGFKFVEPERSWVAYYSDFERPIPNDDAYLRNAYHGSVEAMTKNGKQLMTQRDVFLNERLGSEFVVDGPTVVSYMRAFISGRRLYTLSVDRKKSSGVGTAIPEDVQQFFNSFTYWD